MSLFTHHDVFHLHKILGFGCLAHYGYRIFNKFMYGTMFFDPNSIITYIMPAAHMTLSLSSFIFRVPKNRFNTKAIIWKELQLHNIIFTSRSVCMMYHALLMPYANINMYFYSRLAIVGIHHIAADVVTHRYQIDEKTTTRDIPYDTDNKVAIYINKKYYAVSQLLALIGVLVSKNCENGFLIMFPIQLSTFLMTLVRKNIISNNTWHVMYGLSLAIPYITNLCKLQDDKSNIYIAILFIASRLVFNFNKYLNMVNLTFMFTSVQHLRSFLQVA